jgi:hypothetical protein
MAASTVRQMRNEGLPFYPTEVPPRRGRGAGRARPTVARQEWLRAELEKLFEFAMQKNIAWAKWPGLLRMHLKALAGQLPLEQQRPPRPGMRSAPGTPVVVRSAMRAARSYCADSHSPQRDARAQSVIVPGGRGRPTPPPPPTAPPARQVPSGPAMAAVSPAQWPPTTPVSPAQWPPTSPVEYRPTTPPPARPHASSVIAAGPGAPRASLRQDSPQVPAHPAAPAPAPVPAWQRQHSQSVIVPQSAPAPYFAQHAPPPPHPHAAAAPAQGPHVAPAAYGGVDPSFAPVPLHAAHLPAQRGGSFIAPQPGFGYPQAPPPDATAAYAQPHAHGGPGVAYAPHAGAYAHGPIGPDGVPLHGPGRRSVVVVRKEEEECAVM